MFVSLNSSSLNALGWSVLGAFRARTVSIQRYTVKVTESVKVSL